MIRFDDHPTTGCRSQRCAAASAWCSRIPSSSSGRWRKTCVSGVTASREERSTGDPGGGAAGRLRAPPAGWPGTLMEGGKNLSAGQRQLLSLPRPGGDPRIPHPGRGDRERGLPDRAGALPGAGGGAPWPHPPSPSPPPLHHSRCQRDPAALPRSGERGAVPTTS